MIEIYYRFMLRVLHIGFNHKEDLELTKIIKDILDESEISKIQYNTFIENKNYYKNIHFKNGYIIRIWDLNKYFSWMDEGSIYEKTKEGKRYIYSWENKRPSAEIMYKLKNKIDAFKK